MTDATTHQKFAAALAAAEVHAAVCRHRLAYIDRARALHQEALSQFVEGPLTGVIVTARREFVSPHVVEGMHGSIAGLLVNTLAQDPLQDLQAEALEALIAAERQANVAYEALRNFERETSRDATTKP